MLLASDIRGKVDFGVLTIREDEYNAVLGKFKTRNTVKGTAYYEVSEVETDDGGKATVAVARCLDQGHNSAQDAARDLIDDLDPAWILLVGIAGGVPDDGYSLGDVLLASRIYDLSVSAEILEGTTHDREWNATGGPVHPHVGAMLAAIPGWKEKLKGWNTQKGVGKKKPACEAPADLTSDRLIGEDGHRKKVRNSLLRNFPNGKKAPRAPLYSVIPVASANILVKDPDVIAEWKRLARSAGFVEMEAGGVYRAARRPHREYPVLVIRGLSDIVGFKRGAEWTEYACYTAASFMFTLIRAGVCDVGRQQAGVPPPVSPVVAPSNGSDERRMAEEMTKLTYAELEVVTKYLVDQPSSPGTDFTVTDPPAKMEKNRLGNATSKQLIIGLNQVKLVQDYLDHMGKLDSKFAGRLKASFLSAYGRFRKERFDGDDLFNKLADFASGGSPEWQHRAAGLAVLTYLFENCEVFEK